MNVSMAGPEWSGKLEPGWLLIVLLLSVSANYSSTVFEDSNDAIQIFNISIIV